MNQRGFTLLETAIAGGIFALLLGSIASALVTDNETERVIVGHLGAELRCRQAVERMVAELRMADVWGEDLNHNGAMDVDEDLNGNGTLEANWSLEDGTASTSLTFNRRMEERDETGRLVAVGLYSPQITYRLVTDRVVREAVITRTDGTSMTVRSEMASGVAGLQFSRTGQLLTISMDVRVPPRTYKTDRRTIIATIRLMN